MPGPPEAAQVDRGGELLLQDVEVPAVADRAPRGSSRLHQTGALPERDPRLPARPAPGPLDQPAAAAARVGDAAAGRRHVRAIRLVRRAYQLRLGAWRDT